MGRINSENKLVTKKNDKEDEGGLLLGLLILMFLALMQFILFGLMTISYHRYLVRRYFSMGSEGSSVRRINDIKAVLKPFAAIMFGPTLVLFLCILPILLMDPIQPSVVVFILLVESPFIILWFWLSIIMFKWLAVAHFGVIVDSEKDRIVFKFDQESYDVMDYIKLRFIRDLPKMDEVRLSEIGRITRKHGADLYIHGSFGSRRITFTNKQKRDECIFAIQESGLTSAKVPVEFERT